MMTDQQNPPDKKKLPNNLPPAAIRALREAGERREKARLNPTILPVEIRGRKGPEPVRYGDWEKNGIVSDF